MAHAQELIAWAQELEDDQKNSKKMGRDVLAAVGEHRKCHNCGVKGHLKSECPQPTTGGDNGGKK